MKNNLRIVGLAILALSVSVSACAVKTSSIVAENTNANSNANTNASPEPAATPNGGSERSQSTVPEALVAELYKQHDAKKSPFFQTKDRGLVDKYFTKTLADLIWKDSTSAKNEVGAIDGDPLYNAQDVQIKSFAIGKGDVKGDKANVAVTFTNLGEKKTVNFSLVTVNGNWKIDNVLYGGGDSLMKWLTDTYSADPKKSSGPAGEFEGRYQVGPTSCSVKPVKMAFQVRWAKGSGVEMFFFKDGTTFESEAKDRDANSFVFDDENYNIGTFHRADGSTFPIKRLK